MDAAARRSQVQDTRRGEGVLQRVVGTVCSVFLIFLWVFDDVPTPERTQNSPNPRSWPSVLHRKAEGVEGAVVRDEVHVPTAGRHRHTVSKRRNRIATLPQHLTRGAIECVQHGR